MPRSRYATYSSQQDRSKYAQYSDMQPPSTDIIPSMEAPAVSTRVAEDAGAPRPDWFSRLIEEPPQSIMGTPLETGINIAKEAPQFIKGVAETVLPTAYTKIAEPTKTMSQEEVDRLAAFAGGLAAFGPRMISNLLYAGVGELPRGIGMGLGLDMEWLNKEIIRSRKEIQEMPLGHILGGGIGVKPFAPKRTKKVAPEVVKEVKEAPPEAYEALEKHYAEKRLAPKGGEKVKTEPPKPEVVEAPKEAVAEAEPEGIIGLNKVETDALRKNVGLDKLPEAERRTWERTISDAKKAKLDETALETAAEVTKSKRPISDTEHAGMVLKAAKLANEYKASIAEISKLVESGKIEAAAIERMRAEGIIEQFDLLTEGVRYGRREAARVMSIGRMMVELDTYDIVSLMQRARANKGKKLTPQETTKYEDFAKRHEMLEEKYKKLETDYEKVTANQERIIAQRVAHNEAKKAKIKQRLKAKKEDIFAEREAIKKEIEALGYRINDITGATPEAARLIGKLAVSYIREGVVNLDAVVKRVLTDLPDLVERDVWQALVARDPKRQLKAKKEVNRQISSLKRQAQLLLDIEKAEKGIFEKIERKKVDTPAQIKILQKKLRDLRTEAYRSGLEASKLENGLRRINELQDQLANQYRNIRKKRPVESAELKAIKENLDELRQSLRAEDKIAQLNEQLRTGEFEVKKPVKRVKSPDLERRQIELNMLRRQIKGAIEEMAPVTLKKVTRETVNTLRTAKATADMSATLRQGLVLSVRRPKLFLRTFGKSFKAFFSEYKAEQIDAAIKGADHHYIREKSGLYLSPLDIAKVSAREEMFMSRWAEKIPLYKIIVKASERHMISHLNMLRTGAFDQFLAKYPNATRAELSAWADFVNVASGRGNLGKLATFSNTLALFIFAPRFAISRIQTPFKIFQYWKNPRVRKEIAKDYAALVTLGMTTLTLAKLSGAEVGLNPREADFGKIKIGNTRIDIWGGFQQPARLVARIGIGATDKLGWTGKDLTDWQKDINPLELVGRFAAYKSAPLVTIPLELYRGKTIVNEPVTPGQTAIRAVMPMVYEDIYEAYRLDGKGVAAVSGGLSFMGTATQTYRRDKSTFRSQRQTRQTRQTRKSK